MGSFEGRFDNGKFENWEVENRGLTIGIWKEESGRWGIQGGIWRVRSGNGEFKKAEFGK